MLNAHAHNKTHTYTH